VVLSPILMKFAILKSRESGEASFDRIRAIRSVVVCGHATFAHLAD